MASLLGLALLSWLLALITLMYFVGSIGSPFFIHPRLGKSGKPFNLIKFRTLQNRGADLQARRFALGDFLRATSLDELPQLINILRGDMSFVGPRPLPVEYGSLFDKRQWARHTVRPGLTGWAQVNGRNTISWKEKFELDIYYVGNLGFWFDMKILVKTVILLLSFRKDVSLEEKRFTGNG